MKPWACRSTRQWYRTVTWLWMVEQEACHTRLSLLMSEQMQPEFCRVLLQRGKGLAIWTEGLEGRDGRGVLGCGHDLCIYCMH